MKVLKTEVNWIHTDAGLIKFYIEGEIQEHPPDHVKVTITTKYPICGCPVKFNIYINKERLSAVPTPLFPAIQEEVCRVLEQGWVMEDAECNKCFMTKYDKEKYVKDIGGYDTAEPCGLTKI